MTRPADDVLFDMEEAKAALDAYVAANNGDADSWTLERRDELGRLQRAYEAAARAFADHPERGSFVRKAAPAVAAKKPPK